MIARLTFKLLISIIASAIYLDCSMIPSAEDEKIRINSTKLLPAKINYGFLRTELKASTPAQHDVGDNEEDCLTSSPSMEGKKMSTYFILFSSLKNIKNPPTTPDQKEVRDNQKEDEDVGEKTENLKINIPSIIRGTKNNGDHVIGGNDLNYSASENGTKIESPEAQDFKISVLKTITLEKEDKKEDSTTSKSSGNNPTTNEDCDHLPENGTKEDNNEVGSSNETGSNSTGVVRRTIIIPLFVFRPKPKNSSEPASLESNSYSNKIDSDIIPTTPRSESTQKGLTIITVTVIAFLILLLAILIMIIIHLRTRKYSNFSNTEKYI